MKCAITSAAVLALYLVFAHVAHAEPNLEAKVWSAEELQWQSDRSLPAVQSARLWGDANSGEHGMLRRFPAGFAPPPHRHPSVERVIVLSGTLSVQYAGAPKKALGPGSYSEIPAQMVHAVQCEGPVDCVFVLTSSGPFAILPNTASDR